MTVQMIAGLIRAAAVGCTMAASGMALAQPDAPKPASAKLVAGKPELARAYQDLERAMMENAATLDRATIIAVNRGFDTAANSFFMGDFSTAVRLINAEIEKIRPDGGVGRSIGVRMDPLIVRVGERVHATARFAPIFGPLGGAADNAKLLLSHHAKVTGAGNGPLAEVALAEAIARGTNAEVFLTSKTPTRWTLQLGDAADPAGRTTVGWMYSTSESLDDLRTSLLATLDGLDPSQPNLREAVAACRSRVRLLSDRPSTDNTYTIVGNLLELVEGTKRETKELAEGRDPYLHAAGDFWLTLRLGDGDVPCRLFAPATKNPQTPRPLIIAVHGAGGDENLWMDGYGAGVLRDEAAKRDAIVVTPRVGLGTFMPGTLDALIERVAQWHEVDRSRVYVIGHSLGGGVVTAWAKQRPEKIAAACSIAGVGMFTGAKTIAPMLAYAAEYDGLILADRIRRSAIAAKDAGAPVEFREVADYGHVLVVGKVTAEAVSWLLEHRLAPIAAPPAPPIPPAKPAD